MNREEMLAELEKRGRTEEVALDLSIRKWRDIVEGKGIDEGGDNCALCEFEYSCEDCPISEDGKQCDLVYSPYKNYCCSWGDEQKENARKMLDYLVELRDRLYPKKRKSVHEMSNYEIVEKAHKIAFEEWGKNHRPSQDSNMPSLVALLFELKDRLKGDCDE